VVVRRQRGAYAQFLHRADEVGHGVLGDAPVHEQQVQPVAHAQPVQAGDHQFGGPGEVRRGVDVQHAAAVGVGERAYAPAGRLCAEGPGGVAAAAQDHQWDQVRLTYQGDRALPAGVREQLDRVRVQPDVGETGGDGVLVQGAGGGQRGGAGTQHTGVAGLHQLGSHVDRHVRAGFEVGPDDADRAAAFGQPQSAGQRPQIRLPGRERRVREQPELVGHALQPGRVQPEPVLECGTHPAGPGAFDVLLVGRQDLGLGGDQVIRHRLQRRVDHPVRRGHEPGRRGPGPPAGLGDQRVHAVRGLLALVRCLARNHRLVSFVSLRCRIPHCRSPCTAAARAYRPSATDRV
jgi:hypothetical protein